MTDVHPPCPHMPRPEGSQKHVPNLISEKPLINQRQSCKKPFRWIWLPPDFCVFPGMDLGRQHPKLLVWIEPLSGCMPSSLIKSWILPWSTCMRGHTGGRSYMQHNRHDCICGHICTIFQNCHCQPGRLRVSFFFLPCKVGGGWNFEKNFSSILRPISSLLL